MWAAPTDSMNRKLRNLRKLPLFPLLPFGPLLLFGGMVALEAFILGRMRRMARSLESSLA